MDVVTQDEVDRVRERVMRRIDEEIKRWEEIGMTKEQALRLLDILANALGSSDPLNERTDLQEALTNLRTEIDRETTALTPEAGDGARP